MALGGLAVAGAARDLGLLRVAVPQRRGQVPESWRRELPVAVWTPAYGAMLGLGVLTFQVVSTFWVAAGGALVIGDPVVAAGCMAMFGLGRVLMVVLPTSLAPTPQAAVARVAPLVGAVRRVNALVLVVLAGLALAAAPAAAQVPAPVARGAFDPSVAGAAVARTEATAAGSAVVVRAGRVTVRIPDASSPALNGELLAYRGPEGIVVSRWRTGEVVGQVPGDVTRPALDWPYLAYVRVAPRARALEVRDLRTGRVRRVARVGHLDDLGRPVMRGRVLVWAEAGGRGSRLMRMRVPGGRPVRVAATVRARVITSPSVGAGRMAWVEMRARESRLVVARGDGRGARVVLRVPVNRRILWTTAVARRSVHVTLWSLSSRQGRVLRVPLR
ncbi:MAG TPA: hypothetical protein VNT51_11385 [Miltoncostaeaceae bacterium]|nr:hypothetical protein [Miltoncostaeaceae bacterium]